MSSRAVLVGTWDYEHFPAVPAARNSLERMRALLVGELCDWPADRVTVIGNRVTPGDLHDELIELYSDVDSVALFYYVGQAQPDSRDRLCLGLTGSRTDHHRRASTSLRFDDVRDALGTCAARTKIVLLDCCFSALTAQPQRGLSAAGVLDMLGDTGAYTMVASGTPWSEPGVDRPQSYFTKYFADVVESGIGRDPESMKLNRVFAKARTNLRRDHMPEPAHTARHPAGRIVFARNAATIEEDPTEESVAELLTELGSGNDAAAVLRRIARRPLPDIVELIAELARRNPDPDALHNHVWPLLSSLDERSVEDRVELVMELHAAGREDVADDLAGLLGWGTVEEVLLAVDLLRAKEQDEPTRNVLRSAGYSKDVVGLVGRLAEEERADDIREMARSTRRLAKWQRKELVRDFQRSTIPEATWRPLVRPLSLRERRKDPLTRRDWQYQWQMVLATYGLYSPLTFLLGTALPQVGALSPAGWLRFAVSVAAVAGLAGAARFLVVYRHWLPTLVGSVTRLAVWLGVVLVLGFVAGHWFEPLGAAVRTVLTWGF